jgi:hypothetical protein
MSFNWRKSIPKANLEDVNYFFADSNLDSSPFDDSIAAEDEAATIRFPGTGKHEDAVSIEVLALGSLIDTPASDA